MMLKLNRNRTLTVTNWLSENEFIGLIDSQRNTEAVYGWSKGASFMVYTVNEGHIQRIGTIKREALDVPASL